MTTLGRPRVHLRRTESTNNVARDLAARGAVHGTMVTAEQQTAGRGRQGRSWHAPPGDALLCSWVVRDPPPLLSLAAGAAVAELCGTQALIKWPNDVLLGGRKVAGILVEARPAERWAVLGIGVNAAVALEDLPAEISGAAATLGLGAADLQPALEQLCAALGRWLAASGDQVLAAVRARDALYGRPLRWAEGSGTGAGIDAAGRLILAGDDGSRTVLDAGEVHIGGLA
ncbi:MAG: biotin--[acetyl-CoA-carboxylase] ligase [Actinomycetota bacterium]|nr:biotin--[acetyl-CoA-carboxylase] ligase [Actinomycetota bacterium]